MKELLTERREKLNNTLENNSLILLFAATDESISFLQNKNFYYFTGLEIPEAILIMTKKGGKIASQLFIERTIPERIVWEGAKMSKDTAGEISGIDRIFYLDEFERVLTSQLTSIERIFIDLEPHLLGEPLNRPVYHAEQLRIRNPHICFIPVSKLVSPLRMIKDEWEIEQLKRAIDVTGKGLNRVFRETRSGMFEYQLEAMLQYEMMFHGLKNWGFKPIVATGSNGVTLHYSQNRDKIGRNDLVLIDVGALCNNYSADISRTFPVAAKFTKRQKEVYTEVLKAQEGIISIIEPGITLKELNKKTVEFLTESLLRLKVIKKEEEYRKYYMHSVSHFLGMDAHDVSIYHADSILEPGNVITVEPGLYIEEESIGVRIEDDILVTDTGCEVLSAKIPKQVEELESLRSKGLEKK